MSHELPNLVSRMLELDLQKRPTSVIEVRETIKLALHMYPFDRVEIYTPSQKSRGGASSGVSRRRVLALGGGLVAIGGMYLFASVLGHHQTSVVASYSTGADETPIADGADGDTPIPSKVRKLTPAWQHTFSSAIKCVARGSDASGSVVACIDNSLSVLLDGSRVVDMGHTYPTDHLVCVPFSGMVASWQHQGREVILWSQNNKDPYDIRFSVPSSIVVLAGSWDHVAVVCEDHNVYITEYRRLAESNWAAVTSSVQIGSSVRDLAMVVDQYNSVYFVVGYADGLVAAYTNGRNTHLYMHKAMVNEVSCSPALYNIASASDDGTVIVSGLQDPTLHITYRGHANVGGKVRHVAWLNDTSVASLDHLGNLHIWSIAALGSTATIDKPDVAQTAVVNASLNAWGTGTDELYLAFARDKRTLAVCSVAID
ncbi:WD40 repeat domain-containing protein [Ktedonobacter robiniae]|uniref:Protein kinase domain-containing protein n=1 Tax=Ktedonobacter robiniae TaxID=2778365 RepID=A0ABQ3UJU7_9CHLR|nr:WD40 repeat domain-containing protein [Ktedonobacter robiniae]GHO53002.1 hypothetical protein KSB_14770 [Ktedonobacter robiniae]